MRKYIKEVSDGIKRNRKINKFNALVLNRMKIINYVNQKNNELNKLLNKYWRHQVHINVRIDETKVVNIERDNDDELLKMMLMDNNEHIIKSFKYKKVVMSASVAYNIKKCSKIVLNKWNCSKII